MGATAKIPSGDTLVDLSYHRIRKDITEEFLVPGEKINLASLCDRYGISQTPIKQALNRLIIEGLVESIPRKGYKVRRVTWRDIDEVFELRLMMELHFAAQATAAVGSNILLQEKFQSNLEKNLESVKNFITAEEYFNIYEMDKAFHELYMMSSGNKTALNTYKNLYTHSYSTYLYGKQPKNKTVEGIQEHVEIYRAMVNGDVDEVCRKVQIHNENARSKIQLTLKVSNLL